MCWNRENLAVAVYQSLEFHVAATLRDEHETEVSQDANDLLAGQPTKLGHASDRFRR